jgi:hypothetical protein
VDSQNTPWGRLTVIFGFREGADEGGLVQPDWAQG